MVSVKTNHKSINAINMNRVVCIRFKLKSKQQNKSSNENIEGSNNSHILIQWIGLNMNNNTGEND
jgi:hypothetical protein